MFPVYSLQTIEACYRDIQHRKIGRVPRHQFRNRRIRSFWYVLNPIE